jgi:RNA polymerase sigma-70 factor (ECF subfamily)
VKTARDPDTGELLDAAAAGDAAARQRLLNRHRDRLVRMVAVRLDPRVARRVDPSDVVQDALTEAVKKLDDYLVRRPTAFYPWLRHIAWESLVKCHERHSAGKRTVERDEPLPLSDLSVLELAERLIDSGSGPSGRLMRREAHARVRTALQGLERNDREVLVLRYLEQLSTAETAAVLNCTSGAVKVRLLRALRRLRDRLDENEVSS